MSRLFKRRWRIAREKYNSVTLKGMKQTALLKFSGIRVPCTTLDSVQSLKLKQVDFVKMNIEGAERLALPGMGAMLQKTKNICISCHDFLADEGGPSEFRTKANVIAFLKQNGFAITLRGIGNGRFNVRDYVYGLNEKLLTKQKDNLTERRFSRPFEGDVPSVVRRVFFQAATDPRN